ncbi:MAG TPA: response regulator [Candidatus Methylomirabilis sp.]|nr:response regulator [Candidatus Methylomirabilis sp.]
MIAIQKPQGMAPKVLVVDDEEDIVTYLVAVLEDNGFRAVGESKATAVLDTIHKERPDLILLDIMMPGQSGLSLYRAIRKDSETADVPVFIISGYSQERDFAVMAGGLETQVARLPDGYLEKPISIPALLRNLHELFERQGNGG